jgi:glycosyltransferase involved in cell wall biosynthesis
LKATLLITTFNRDHLLKLTLPNIVRQNLTEIEVIVLNDGEAGDTAALCKQHGVGYLYTRPHNVVAGWRIPGFAFNIGARLAQGEVLILSCAEMLHLNDCIKLLIDPVLKNPMNVGMPTGRQDISGRYLQDYKLHQKHTGRLWSNCGKLKCELPFLLAVSRKVYYDIGGYDEDFIGQAFDDTDFYERTIAYGCNYIKTGALTVHLWHQRAGLPGREEGGKARWQYNKGLYENRKGSIIRNKNREWGRYDGLTGMVGGKT